jgi:ketosteroid isomerase-like protein
VQRQREVLLSLSQRSRAAKRVTRSGGEMQERRELERASATAPSRPPQKSQTSETRPEHPNIDHYRRMIAAFNANDLATVSRLVSPHIDYIVPGESPIAGRTHDVAGLVKMLTRSKELSGGTLHLEPRCVVADDSYLFVYGRVTAGRNGKTLDGDHCVMFRFEAGVIVEGRTLPVDLYAFDQFWA